MVWPIFQDTELDSDRFGDPGFAGTVHRLRLQPLYAIGGTTNAASERRPTPRRPPGSAHICDCEKAKPSPRLPVT
jgi:hypothetical protein